MTKWKWEPIKWRLVWLLRASLSFRDVLFVTLQFRTIHCVHLHTQKITYCYASPSGPTLAPEDHSLSHNYDAAGAFVARDKIWEGRNKLTVFFLNEEVIDEWKCGSSQMTVETIMAWAETWNSPLSDKIPKFLRVEKQPATIDGRAAADIRVKCTSK